MWISRFPRVWTLNLARWRQIRCPSVILIISCSCIDAAVIENETWLGVHPLSCAVCQCVLSFPFPSLFSCSLLIAVIMRIVVRMRDVTMHVCMMYACMRVDLCWRITCFPCVSVFQCLHTVLMMFPCCSLYDTDCYVWCVLERQGMYDQIWWCPLCVFELSFPLLLLSLLASYVCTLLWWQANVCVLINYFIAWDEDSKF